jgi:hypothetical protein
MVLCNENLGSMLAPSFNATLMFKLNKRRKKHLNFNVYFNTKYEQLISFLSSPPRPGWQLL